MATPHEELTELLDRPGRGPGGWFVYFFTSLPIWLIEFGPVFAPLPSLWLTKKLLPSAFTAGRLD
ncbi:MAG TPA: hypothetical protein VGJ05_15215, partial [Fimbriiglobus sp.]